MGNWGVGVDHCVFGSIRLERYRRNKVLGTVLTKEIHKGRVDGVETAGRGRDCVTRSRRRDKVEAA